jgi:hypothetical protein
MGLRMNNHDSKEVAYSTNDEEFIYDDVGDVLDALDCDGWLEVGQVYYEIDVVPCNPREFLQAGLILENADQMAYDELGETSEDLFAVGTEAEAELQALLDAWADKHLAGTRLWKCVGKSRGCVVTEEDLGATSNA